jgi:hypothetical protein
MNRLFASLLLLASAAFAQLASPARPVASINIDQPHLSFDIVQKIERQFDQKLGTPGLKEPFDLIGPTRGLYMQGYGMVLTAEVDLIVVPGAYALIRHTPTGEEKAQIHARKLEQLRILEQAMRDMLTSSAQQLDIMPQTEHVVLAVRLLYKPWEDTSNLPTQILMSADRKSAIAGQIKEESSK